MSDLNGLELIVLFGIQINEILRITVMIQIVIRYDIRIW